MCVQPTSAQNWQLSAYTQEYTTQEPPLHWLNFMAEHGKLEGMHVYEQQATWAVSGTTTVSAHEERPRLMTLLLPYIMLYTGCTFVF